MLVAALPPLLLLLFCGGVQGQQGYVEKDHLGYLCSNNKSVSQCSTYVVYRARVGDTVQLISDRFSLSRQQVALASNISDSQQLVTNQLLLIPILTCSCISGRSQYNVTYIIQKGDTMYLVSTGTFEGLTTYQAVETANPSAVPTNLHPGDHLIFPIRCACPSTEQSSKGVQLLVTYPTTANDSVQSISKAWNVSSNDILLANELTPSSGIIENTTLLLPFKQAPTLSSSPPPQTPLAPSPPVPPSPVAVAGPSGSSSNTGLIVGVACGAAALITVLLLLICYVFRRKRRKGFQSELYGGVSYQTQTKSAEDDGKNPEKVEHLKGDLLAGMSDLVDTDRPLWYNFEELKQATQNFSAAHRIQGSVYRGVVRERAVAIKKMKGGMSQELKILCKVHHSNLIKLLGISVNEEEHVFLVYELAENGSLSACLHRSPFSSSTESSSSSSFLRWNTRLQIALDVATALEYIHDYTKPSFVHKDLKSSNILLDENFRAKVANFGMAKLAADMEAAPMLTKHISGTQGYMAPEYLAHGVVTPKLDVYAFGVILLELLSGHEAIMRSMDAGQLPETERFLSAMIGPILDSDQQMEKFRNWMDPVLQDAYPQDCALQVAILARSCVHDDPHARSSMRDITYTLSKLLAISLEWEVSANLQRDYLDNSLEGR
ncbi:hypothetical protein O6H91_16G002200 [Diphasiastrum complanatum]|nr:hypothetical protein O6H91_16G002200 [Diphasiastrum complanatum]